MKTRTSIFSKVLVVAFACSSMPISAGAKTNCQKFYDKYLKASGHKAFATTRGNDPGYDPTTCSFFAGFTFKKLAEKKAVTDCNRHSRPEDGGHCQVIDSR